jgi:hypothetical protein
LIERKGAGTSEKIIEHYNSAIYHGYYSSRQKNKKHAVRCLFSHSMAAAAAEIDGPIDRSPITRPRRRRRLHRYTQLPLHPSLVS